jgi:hypothetical protein
MISFFRGDWSTSQNQRVGSNYWRLTGGDRRHCAEISDGGASSGASNPETQTREVGGTGRSGFPERSAW